VKIEGSVAFGKEKLPLYPNQSEMTLLSHVLMFSSVRHRFSPEKDEMLQMWVLRIGSNDSAMIAQSCPAGLRGSASAATTAVSPPTIEKYREVGPRWAYISRFLTGRTGNDVKSR
jgi:hypothetical protein